MTRLRIGIIGCGEVTQIIHLPALQYLADQYKVTAICDISPAVMDGVGERLDDVAKYTDYAELVRDPGVDAVLIANPHVYHADAAIAAMDNAKHVFIEKPMCMTYDEADALVEAQARSGMTVQIGYMRRHAGAFLEAIELVRSQRNHVKFARVHDFIGANALIVADTSNVIRDATIPEKVKEATAALARSRMKDAVGQETGPLASAYGLLLGLSSHDISTMRDLIGRPERVLHASVRQGGRCITALFDFGDFVCEFATGVDEIPRYDTFLEVYCQDAVIRVDYDTPYVRNLPARLTVTTAEGPGGVARRESYSSRLDTFVTEWKVFHDHIGQGTTPRTSINDAREDLDITNQIISLLRDDPALARG